MALPTKGLFTDSAFIDQPAETHRDARNIVFTKKYGAILNEPGFEDTAIGYPTSIAKPIGVIMFPDNVYTILSDGYNGGEDRIGIVNLDGIYTDIIIDDILGFDINYPIRSSEIDYNYLSQRIISWTDRNQKPRILNIDNLPFTLNPDKSLVNSSEIIELDIFTSFLCPNIQLTSTPESGGVKSGNYSFSLAYENNDGTRTGYSVFQGNINIISDNINIGVNQVDGDVPGTLTSKAIKLNINNIDVRYDKLVLIGISRINNIVSAFEIKKISTSSASIISGVYNLNVTYIGTETVVPLTLNEVLQTLPLYNKSGCMTQLNNVLYHGDLEVEDTINYQQYANNIRIFYNTKLVDINDITKSHKNNLSVGFAHGAVYAFYIQLLLRNGSYSKAFHIPGRSIYGGESPSPISTSSLAGAESLSAKKYQVEDTTNKGGHLYAIDANGTYHVTSTSVNTNMGYWENKDEKYPLNFNGLDNTLVKHHVFPSIRECKNRHYNSYSTYGTEKLDILGIDIAGVVIPPNLINQVVGYRILYAKRDYIDSNSYGTDIFQYAAKLTTDSNKIWSTGGNWAINTRDASGPAPGGHLLPRTDYIRGHSFELLKDKPQLGNTNLYFDIELKIRKQGLRPILTYTDFPTNGSINSGGNLVSSGVGSTQNPGGIVDYTGNDVINTYNSNQILKSVSNFRYLPSGIIDGEIYTIKNEESYSMKINFPTISPSISFTNLDWSTISRGAQYLFPVGQDFEETYLITLKQVKDNLYANFDQQVLIATDQICIPNLSFASSVLNIYGGDTFISKRSYITLAPPRDNDTGGNNGMIVFKIHLTESRYNIGLRYEEIGNQITKYVPKTNPFDFWTVPSAPTQSGVTVVFNTNSNPNGLAYSNDSNAINDLAQPIIYNPSQIETTKFPFRVIRSGFAGTNAQSIRSWKTYLIGDNYEANRNKGAITNITAMDDILLIHHRHALFRTTGKDKMLLSTTEVFLGTLDIFAQQPKDMIPSKLGNLGTQNIFGCITFKGGYFWQDQQNGKIFLLTSNNVEELNDNGQRIFFYDSLKINNSLPDNPLIGQGLIAGFDKVNNRILLTKRGDNPFTISYSVDYKSWACFHDYLPDYYFFNNDNLFCFGNNKIKICDSDTKKGIYLDDIIYPSYIDIVFNPENEIDKLYFGADWISEVFDSTGVIKLKETITSIQGRTSYQDSGEIILNPTTSFGDGGNTRAKINQWRFNKLKASNNDVFKKRPLRDKYCIIRLKYDNHTNLDLTQNSLYLYDFNAKARKAEL